MKTHCSWEFTDCQKWLLRLGDAQAEIQKRPETLTLRAIKASSEKTSEKQAHHCEEQSSWSGTVREQSALPDEIKCIECPGLAQFRLIPRAGRS